MLVRAAKIKLNDTTKYVELFVEDLRTRVRFPPAPPIKGKPTLRGWLFFDYYRVFARVPADSCGLRRESFLPVTGRFYSPFAHSLSDPPHQVQAEVRKAHPSPLYKSTGYARTNQAVFLQYWQATETAPIRRVENGQILPDNLEILGQNQASVLSQGVCMQVKTIAEQLFFTTVRIDTITVDGGHGSGTGFVFGHKFGVDKQALFVVTNKHVISGMNEGRFSFLKQKDGLPTLGDGFTLNISPQDWPNMWFGHPDPTIDIAICPLQPLIDFVKQQNGTDLFFRVVDSSMIPTQQQIEGLDAVESVTFIGYPNGVWDSKNLLPVARRGTTASPIEVDFEGTPRFLIDASVFGGSSGSPVFILNHGSWATKDGGLVVGSRFHFVGVIAAVFFRTHMNQIIPVPIPTQVQPMAQQQEMIDLGIVFKARTVVETIEAFLKKHNIEMSAVVPGPEA